jgi:hypothetical protein
MHFFFDYWSDISKCASVGFAMWRFVMAFQTWIRGGLLAGVVALSGCIAPTISGTDFSEGSGASQASVASWSLADVIIEIPEGMPISEDASVRYPSPETLVWWGDPPGDRKQQVRELFADAVRAGAIDAMVGTQPVIMKIKIDQFHAMTPKARATNIQLGVHELRFDISVVDAASGKVLATEDDVNADFRAFSGAVAIEAERAGQGQKIRIQTRIAQVIRAWLLA